MMILYQTFELVFRGDEPDKSFSEIDLKAEFSLGSTTTSVSGFYDGDGVYRIRYLPLKEGLCRWNVTGIFTACGEELCRKGNLNGPVRADGLHFKYECGKQYYPFGTTVYALVHQPPELIETTLKTLGSSPFNKVRICVFPKDYEYNRNEPELYPFAYVDGGWDVHRPNPHFWQRLEYVIRRLDKMEIQCDLILFHPYDRWGFSRFTRQQCEVYLDYLARRLSAFENVWWSLANEYDLMRNYCMEDWTAFSKQLCSCDPYRHLLSSHNCFGYWDFSQPETTHCSVQDICVGDVSDFQDKYHKPVIFDECCYEGNIPMGWGNISGFEMVHRFWTAVASGGYCTHGETYLNSDEILWWSKGGKLTGQSPERIAFLRDIVESLPGPLTYIKEGAAVFDADSVAEYRKNGLPEDLKHNWWADGLISLPQERVKEFISKSRMARSGFSDRAFLWYYGRQCP